MGHPFTQRRSRSAACGILLHSDNTWVSEVAYPLRFLQRVGPSSLRCPRTSDASLAMAWAGPFSSLLTRKNSRAPAGTVEEARAHVQNRHVGHPAKMSARRHLKYYLKVYLIITKYSNGFADVLERKRLAFGIRMGVFPKWNKKFERAMRRPFRRRSGGLGKNPEKHFFRGLKSLCEGGKYISSAAKAVRQRQDLCRT